MNDKRILPTLLLMTMLLSSCASRRGRKMRQQPTTIPEQEPRRKQPTRSTLTCRPGDFGGETLKFLGENMTTWAIIELCADELDGDLINDTMYAIDRRVEDKLNIKISAEYRPPRASYATS